MCGCECCTYTKIIHSSLISYRDRYLKNKISNRKFSKQKVWGKKKIAYIKHIKIRSCHMGVIFIPKHLICQRKPCMNIHSHIMHHHTVNVSYGVVKMYKC